VALLEECIKIDSGFEQFRTECAMLTDCYTTTRYPDTAQYADFTEQKAKEAYELAARIVTFVKEKPLD